MLDSPSDATGLERPQTLVVSTTPDDVRVLPAPGRGVTAWVRATGIVVLVGVAFGAGVLTGVVGAPTKTVPAPASTFTPSVLDEAADRIAASAARPVDRGLLERAAVEGMLKALGDRWARYLDNQQYTSFQETLDGRYSGVGVWLRTDASGNLSVASVQAGSPAARAGLVDGDQLVKVGSLQARDAGVGAVTGALRGKPGTAVSVVISRDGTRRTLRIVRDSVNASDVTIDRLTGGTEVVRISSFSRGVGREVRAALSARDTTGTPGVVLDLRGNPGGLLSEAVEVASIFLDGGAVVTYERRGAPAQTLDAVGVGDTTTPVVVLVDSGTASAAEIVAAALQDRNRAVVVGSRTYGKGSVQEPAQLSDGSAVEITVGRYRTPSGRLVDGVGIEPDVLIAPSAGPAVAESRATDVLRGLVASLPGGGS